MAKVVGLILVAVLLSGILFWQMERFAYHPSSSNHEKVVFEVPYNTGLHFVARQLEDQGLISDAKEFIWLVKLTGNTARLKVGEYALYKDMSPHQILNILTSGESIRHALVVPEGSNIFDIRDSLNRMWPHRGDEFLKFVTDAKKAKEITGQQMNSLEGYLFPDTYLITKFTPVSAIVRMMYNRFEEAIRSADQGATVKMSVREQVTLASIIEKETGAPNERALISSVFHNRLKKGMRLQSDPTIIYGMWLESGTRPVNIRRSDISRPTAYNTYVIHALPPGPIANPGKDALWAAVHPAETRYLYFVSRNDGTHVFSENFAQHLRAVQKYQLNPRAREGKSWRDLSKKLAKEKAHAS